MVFCSALAVFAPSPLLADSAGDPEAGKKVFNKCKACHQLESDSHRIGPSLMNVIGRTAGTAEGFKYSKGMIAYGESGVVWSEEALVEYLEKPRESVEGTKMAFPGLKKIEDRQNVAAYIAQYSDAAQ